MEPRKLTLPASVVSALVNLIDTARDNEDAFNGLERQLQADREYQILAFLNNSQSDVTLRRALR